MENYNAGNTATISAFGSGLVTFTGLANMTQNSVGGFLSVSGAEHVGQQRHVLDCRVHFGNERAGCERVGGVPRYSNSGAIFGLERLPYSLMHDLDFERSD